MADYEFTGLGYRRDLEDTDALFAGAQPIESIAFGDFDCKAMGKPMGLEDVIRIENQGQMNSCAGNSFTSVTETCVYHQSARQSIVQLSRMFAYVNGQRYSRISGDHGASLHGVVQGGVNDGLPLEQYADYTGMYYTQFSRQAYDRAADFKLKTRMPCKDADQAYQGLSMRLGALYIGMAWQGQFKNPLYGGIVDNYRESGNAYHAVCMLDWSTVLDEKGYPRLKLFNSHGRGYGVNGISLWSYDALNDALHSPNTVAYFLSDMEFMKPRFDFKKAIWTDRD